MSKVFVDVGMSLDGYIAGPNARPGNPLGDGGVGIHDWKAFAPAYGPWPCESSSTGRPRPVAGAEKRGSRSTGRPGTDKTMGWSERTWVRAEVGAVMTFLSRSTSI